MSNQQHEDTSDTTLADLPDEKLIVLYSIRLHEYTEEHNYSRKKCLYDVAREFRDDHQVNIFRVLERNDWMHPAGYHWNIDFRGGEELLQIFDPVVPESRDEGGTADFQPGDVIEYDGDGLVILAVGESHLAAINKAGKVDTHALATVRNLFTTEKYDVRLIRDGEVVRR
jgi:hypothetical protein